MNSGTIVVYSFLGALALGTTAYIYFFKNENLIAGAEKVQNGLFEEVQGSSTATANYSVGEAADEVSYVSSILNGSSGSSGGSKRKKQSKNKRKNQSKNKRKKKSKKGGK